MVWGIASAAVLMLGLVGLAACSGVDDPNGGANAPCTRTKDCERGLVCTAGVCRDPDAPDAGPVGDAG